jgi:tetratricopeptide (TPR) repeat protein
VVHSLVNRVLALDFVRNKVAERYFKQGLHSADQNKIIDAQQQYQKALSWNPSDANVRANINIGLGKICPNATEAIGYYTHAIDCHAQERSITSIAYLFRGQYNALLERYDDALADLNNALLDCHGNKSEILFEMSKIHCKKRRYQEAMDKCNEALKECQEKQQAIEHLRILAEISWLGKNHEYPPRYLELALNLMGVERNGQFASLLSQKGMYYFYLHAYDIALADINAALDCALHVGQKPQLLFNRGMVFQALGNTASALKDLQAAKECHPEDSHL